MSNASKLRPWFVRLGLVSSWAVRRRPLIFSEVSAANPASNNTHLRLLWLGPNKMLPWSELPTPYRHHVAPYRAIWISFFLESADLLHLGRFTVVCVNKPSERASPLISG